MFHYDDAAYFAGEISVGFPFFNDTHRRVYVSIIALCCHTYERPMREMLTLIYVKTFISYNRFSTFIYIAVAVYQVLLL